MSLPFNITNPGWNITSLLTSQEASFVTDLYAAGAGASENEVLTWKSGAPSWEASASGFADPLTTNGDIIARVSGVTTRLAKGSDGSYLGVSGGVLGYYTPAGSGDVTGPASSTDSNFALYNGTTGKIIKDGGVKASDFATAGHNHTGVYAPVLGADDNYVTDAEKAALHSHSNKTILDNTTASFITAQETKLGYISVTQAVNLDTMESDIATNNAKVTNATHTGEVTGSGALTVDKTAITGKTAVTAVGTDYVLISDTSDSGNLKKALVSDFGGGSGNVTKVGTPVDNQIGVWTGDGTIEGDTALTFDTSTDTLTIPNVIINTGIVPDANDGAYLGTSSLGFSDLFLAEGGVINWDNGDATLTQSGDTLTLAGADLIVPDEVYGVGWDGSLEVPTKNAVYDKIQSLTGGGNVSKVGTPVDNQIGVWTGDGTIEGDTGLTWDGGMGITVSDTENKVGLTITQNDITNDPYALKIVTPGINYPLSIEATSSISAGSFIESYHNSASPAAGDYIGGADFYGNSSTGVKRAYAYFNSKIISTTNGAEYGSFVIETRKNGVIGGAGEQMLEVGAESDSAINGISVGFDNATGIVSSRGNQDLKLQTGNSTTGNINIADGANGSITFTTNGSGDLVFSSSTGALILNTGASSRQIDEAGIRDGSGAIIIGYSAVASPVNAYTFINAATGTPPELQATGTDTNITMKLVPKGNGNVYVTTGIELGHASDTTLSRVSAGVVAVEGNNIVTANNSASASDINTGTSTTKFNTPDALAGSYAGTKSLSVQVFDGTTDVATGDGKAYITIPEALNGMNLVRAQATVVTAGTTNATTVMIHNKTDTQDMLSGAISIASGGTVGTVGTINTSYDDVATNDILRIDVDSVSTTAPKGLMVVLEFRLP